MFNSHYIPVNAIPKQVAILVSNSPTLQVISKQSAILVFHSHLACWSWRQHFTLFHVARERWVFFVYKVLPFYQYTFQYGFFFDWE